MQFHISLSALTIAERGLFSSSISCAYSQVFKRNVDDISTDFIATSDKELRESDFDYLFVTIPNLKKFILHSVKTYWCWNVIYLWCGITLAKSLNPSYWYLLTEKEFECCLSLIIVMDISCILVCLYMNIFLK